MSIVSLQARTLDTHWVSHAHDYHQLIFATSGQTELSIEGRGDRITQETGCLIPSGHHHDYLGDGNNRTLVIDVPTQCLPMLAHSDDVERLFEKPSFYTVPSPLRQLGTALASQAREQPGLHDEIALLIIRSIYLGRFDDAPSPTPHSAVRRRRFTEESLDRVEQYVDAHLDAEIHVNDLARLCFLSPGYFHQAFRDFTGMTPMAYVSQRRMARARALLESSALPVCLIASQVGFRDQGSFSRACRRHFGVAPSQLRA
ncbi:helix-turn-helix transcriptional regulator [Marinobacter fonticola]|uniref:helix-turn-helix transcriptional regulator n=1 Tax=Marinobacter fonticola TaxID=2603215 RepID=UPI0011E6898D|nr:AraC family transcriptional regulator [Marinobacter fonticola]